MTLNTMHKLGLMTGFLSGLYIYSRLYSIEEHSETSINSTNPFGRLFKEIKNNKFSSIYKSDNDLTVYELANQLNVYASFGVGTALNQLFLDKKEIKERTEKDKIYEQYTKIIKTINCLDASYPDDNWFEIQRCEKLKTLLNEKLNSKNSKDRS